MLALSAVSRGGITGAVLLPAVCSKLIHTKCSTFGSLFLTPRFRIPIHGVGVNDSHVRPQMSGYIQCHLSSAVLTSETVT